MTRRRTLTIILVSALTLGWATLGWAPGGAARAAETDSTKAAAAFIKSLGVEVQTIQATAPPRRAALQDLIRGSFDLDLTSQLVLGKFWARATLEQRTAFKDFFAQYLLNLYARQLDAYRVETLAVIASNRVGENDFLVQTSIVRDGDPTDAVWRVRALNGEYRIIDVLIDGISLTLTQRNEFASVIGREGLDGMLAVLRARVSERASLPSGNLRIAMPVSILVSPNVGKIGVLLRQ
jgi:phospholipid transport system substrate-binding protein